MALREFSIREGSMETVVFSLHRAGVPYNLSGKIVRMRRRNSHQVDDVFSTADVTPILTVTDGPQGKVTFAPKTITVWKGIESGYSYNIYFEVESVGIIIPFPETDNIHVTVVSAFGG